MRFRSLKQKKSTTQQLGVQFIGRPEDWLLAFLLYRVKMFSWNTFSKAGRLGLPASRW
jgi:hypothetical protein